MALRGSFYLGGGDVRTRVHDHLHAWRNEEGEGLDVGLRTLPGGGFVDFRTGGDPRAGMGGG